MEEVKVNNISIDRFNPFHANEEELVAQALNDAGLINEATTINNKNVSEFLTSYYSKRSLYRNATRLGTILIESGKIPPEKLQEALDFQDEHKDMKIGDILAKLGICSSEEIKSFMESQRQKRNCAKEK